jgi:acyl dehydratase
MWGNSSCQDGTTMADELPDFSDYLGGDTGPFRAWDRVNAPMIRHWCEAMGDGNPLYTDADAARAEGFSGVVAPPTMMQAWTMYGYAGRRAPGSDQRDPMAVLPVLEAAGYPAVVAVNCEQEYVRYIEEGDDIHHRSTIESISEEKNTALGTGFFVTQLCTYYNQRDEVVGRMRFRVFKYRPLVEEAQVAPVGARSASSDNPGESPTESAPTSSSSTVHVDPAQISIGQDLPQLLIPITPKLIVGAAIASRDYQDVHHDKDAAQALGSPDIFMNILTTNGLVGRYVTDWAGPRARLNKVAIRLGAPNYPGDTMTLTGEVTAVDSGCGQVELAVKGSNQLGDHVTGTVLLTLPR